MKVLIAVTHLLGTGHLARALVLGQSFADQGHVVRVVSGGMPVPRLDPGAVALVQLPPLRADGTDFSRLLTDADMPADEAYLARRTAQLVAEVSGFAPDILITELFPFGRRILSGEFLALLQATRSLPHRVVVLSSVRDILAPPSKPSKAARAEEIVLNIYDGVLVHSDPATTPLDQSWPVTDALRPCLHYTGYVAPPAAGPHPTRAGAGEVLVSAGGGPVGEELFRTAIAAARQMPAQQWRLLVGGGDIAALRARAEGSGALIEPARPDFRQMLTHATASVSMCGYNTALDLLQAATPSVLVPFDAGGEVEQGLRARALATLSGFEVVTSAQLSADALCTAVTHVIAAPRRRTSGIQFDGAARSVEIAVNMIEAAQ